MSVRVRQTVLPVLAALIWGTAFVFQSISTEHVGPLTFTAGRSAIAVVALLPVLYVSRELRRRREGSLPKTDLPYLIKGGICCGLALTTGATLQQAGLSGTSAGKAAFIAALYIVIVPLVRLLFGKNASSKIWCSVVFAVFGLYFLCINEALSIAGSDFILVLSTFGFSAQIIIVDHFLERCDPIALSWVQVLTQFVLTTVGAILFEEPSLSALRGCMSSLIYVGVFSSAVGFTLQIVAQKGTDPTVVSLLLSLESVFGVLAGALMLNETMTSRELLGCALMMTATVFAQLPDRRKTHKTKNCLQS